MSVSLWAGEGGGRGEKSNQYTFNNNSNVLIVDCCFIVDVSLDAIVVAVIYFCCNCSCCYSVCSCCCCC